MTATKNDCLIQRIDSTTGEMVAEWAIIDRERVVSWTADAAAATRMAYRTALKFQAANERRPDAEFVFCRLDDTTLLPAGAPIEMVSDSYDRTRGRADY